MTLIPKSILARTVWVLSIGFLLIVIDSALISILVFKAETKPANMYEIGIAIKTLTALLSNSPNESKAELIRYYQNPNLAIQWHGHNKPAIPSNEYWGLQRFQKHLLEHLNNPNIKQVFIRHSHNTATSATLDVTIQLQDHSWLQFQARTQPHHVQWIINSIVILAVFFFGIYILALLIARQIVKPITRFSDAAMQFSMDINTAPMQPTGPSEIKQAAHAFNVMQKRIRRFVSERMEISAAISHDLRTPLTRLRLRIESIPDQEQQNKSLQDISEMQSILDSTLVFARDDAEKEQKIQMDIAVLLQSLCDSCNDSGAKASYSGPQNLDFHCRPVAMKRAFNNLIDNGVKYGGSARVELKHSSQQLEVLIIDPGPGIESSQQELVFTPFYRVEKSRNRETGGTGLGLTVARTIVRSHGGDITLINQSNHMFIVRVILPNLE